MEVQFLGAARTVTGSCFIISAGGKRFAVDCGMHQGNARIEERNRNSEAYRAGELDFILLTHAHIDHSGLLPLMAKEGFRGPVYCTAPTEELLGIMLEDSAHIQEMEAEWASKKYARRGGGPVEPIYRLEDARAVIRQLRAVRYHEVIEAAPGIRVRFYDAGHILGSSFLDLQITENGKSTRLVFSGDIGRPNALLVDDPDTPVIGQTDYLFLESTYGDREHKNEDKSRDELAEAINYGIANGQKTIIPAFAVERTQEMIYTLYLLQKEGKIPADLPVYVDSPLAIKATQIFRRNMGYFDGETRALLRKGEDPLDLPGLKYTPETKDSQAINAQEGPAVIISASGMCNAGRIKHHLRHNLWRKGASIVFAGFQALGTPGRKIVDGAKSITLLGEEISVEAKIFTIGGFSSHSGQSQLLKWAGHFMHPGLEVVLVHGEEKAQKALSEKIEESFGITPRIPGYLESLRIEAGREPEVMLDKQLAPLLPKSVNWSMLIEDSEDKLARLRKALVGAASRSWEEQVDIQEQILDINKRMMKIASNL